MFVPRVYFVVNQRILFCHKIGCHVTNTKVRCVCCKVPISGVLLTQSGAYAAKDDVSRQLTSILSVCCSTRNWPASVSINTRYYHT